MDCEYLADCGFVREMARIKPYMAQVVRLTYCEKDKGECARYMLAQVVPMATIPDYLWPNEEMQSSDIIDEILNQ